jgi:hypothetical protein
MLGAGAYWTYLSISICDTCLDLRYGEWGVICKPWTLVLRTCAATLNLTSLSSSPSVREHCWTDFAFVEPLHTYRYTVSQASMFWPTINCHTHDNDRVS